MRPRARWKCWPRRRSCRGPPGPRPPTPTTRPTWCRRRLPGDIDMPAIVAHAAEAPAGRRRAHQRRRQFRRAGCIASSGTTAWPRATRRSSAPTNGAMGYGVPAGIAANLVSGRTALTMAGDGDFLMNGQELATAVQHGAKTIIVLLNNGMYGTIRMHQEREYPEHVSGTRAGQPRLRGAGARLWLCRRAHHAHGRVRTGVAGRAGAPAGHADRDHARPGSHHHARHAQQHPAKSPAEMRKGRVSGPCRYCDCGRRHRAGARDFTSRACRSGRPSRTWRPAPCRRFPSAWRRR